MPPTHQPQPPTTFLPPAGCSQLEKGVALQGGQGLAAGPRASLRSCYQACADRPECTAFTFVPYQNMCYLRAGGVGAAPFRAYLGLFLGILGF